MTTNRDLLVAVLEDEAFRAGETTTGFLSERFPTAADRRFPPASAAADLAVVVALVEEHVRDEAPAWGSVPSGFSNTGLGPLVVPVLVGGERREATIERDRVGAWQVDAAGDGATVTVRVLARDGHRLRLDVEGHRFAATVHVDGPSVQVVLPGANVTLHREPRFPAAATVHEPGAALSPMPGAVVEVLVQEGQAVTAGDPLVVVEAMKMEHRIGADVDGIVAEVRVEAGAQVQADDVLVVVEPAEDT